MKEYCVRFLPHDKSISVNDGTTLLSAAVQAGLDINALCGGNGICGKCIMITDSNPVLSCKTHVHSDITAYIPIEAGHKILTDGIGHTAKADPLIKRINIQVEKPTVTDARSLWERVAHAIEDDLKTSISTRLYKLSGLNEELIRCGYNADVIVCEDKLLKLVRPNAKVYAMAFDIGTTTLVGYLLDLANAAQLAAVSSLNPQSKYGADVISRANHALKGGLSDLMNEIRGELNRLIVRATQEASILADDIVFIAIAGNTCMHHLCAGISPESLVKAPYTPVLSTCLIVDAAELELCACPDAAVALLPNIAGFVGSDTVCAVLSSTMHESEEVTLIIDIGTNGELVLGSKNRMIACSTAAGPAFEGCNISCGMRGAEGAIDHVSLINGAIKYSVIGDVKPSGICGSGLIDAVAQFVKHGIIDETGLFAADCGEYAGYMTQIDGMKAFKLCDGVHITQKDIREVQLAKGAMSAGIKLLAEALGIEIKDIDRVYLAGAFGNYISPASACDIKLIPPELISRIFTIGNAAGQGAKLCAVNKDELLKAQFIADKCGYLELASLPQFQDVFINELGF